MKIVFVSSFFYPNVVGGAEISLGLLSKGLAARGAMSSWSLWNTKLP